MCLSYPIKSQTIKATAANSAATSGESASSPQTTAARKTGELVEAIPQIFHKDKHFVKLSETLYLYIYIYTVSSTKAVVFCSFYIAATANGSPTLRHISDKPTLVSSHPIRSNPLMMCRSLRGGNSPLNRRELAAPPGGSSRSSGFGSYSWTDRVGSRRRRRSTPAPFTRGSRLATRGVKGTGSSSSSAAR